MNKIFTIIPDDENALTYDYCMKNLKALIEADTLLINIQDYKNRPCLFNFGMAYAHNAFAHIINENPKKIELIKGHIQTPEKSYTNVARYMQEHGFPQAPNYSINPRKAFMISSVRVADEDMKAKLKEIKKELIDSQKFDIIHLPFEDTKQDEDPIGTRICLDNLIAEATSGTTIMHYNPGSFGSVADLGCYFMLKNYFDKKIPNFNSQNKRKFYTINKDDITEATPYAGLVRDIEKYQ